MTNKIKFMPSFYKTRFFLPGFEIPKSFVTERMVLIPVELKGQR